MFNTDIKRKIISEFPALSSRFGEKRLVYLDSACTALKIKSCAEAEKKFLLSLGGCGGKRSVHILSQKTEEEFSGARQTAAQFIGADSPEEIIFTGGTTESANILASSFPFTRAKNEVILSPVEHNSVFLPFYNLYKQGKIKLGIIPLKNFGPDFKVFSRMISGKTALVCVTRASNIFGGAIEADRFVKAAHLCGAKVFIDEAQYVTSHKEDIKNSNADFAAFSGHKLGADFGIGVLYVKKNLMEMLGHSKVGGGIIQSVTLHSKKFEVSYLEGYAGFEAGIQNYSGAVSLAHAIKFLSSLGFENIRQHVRETVNYAYKKLSGFKGIKIAGAGEHLGRGSIISVLPENRNFSMPDFNLFLNHGLKDRVIAVRTGRHCADLAVISSGIPATIRLSFFIYTTRKDIDDFCSALKIYLKNIDT